VEENYIGVIVTLFAWSDSRKPQQGRQNIRSIGSVSSELLEDVSTIYSYSSTLDLNVRDSTLMKVT
jgi:hypothetical protein